MLCQDSSKTQQNLCYQVYRATGEDYANVAGGATSEALAFLSRGAQVIVRMRGLPYDATPQQVVSTIGIQQSAFKIRNTWNQVTSKAKMNSETSKY